MRGRGHCADNAEGRVFFERDAVIAAVAVGVKPIDAGNEIDDLQFFDLMIEPADLRLIQFQFAP